MSRLRRLKEKNNKNTLKTAMTSLALALAMGFTQTIGVYAWFTDSENVGNDLVINTGELELGVGKGFEKTDLDLSTLENNSFKHNFDISNLKTLDQHIRLSLDCNNIDISQYITYDLKLMYGEREIQGINGTLFELVNQEILLKYKDADEIVELKAKSLGDVEAETIKAEVTITIDPSISEKISGNALEIDLKAYATQVNNVDGSQNFGFTDLVKQENLLKVIKTNIITGDNVSLVGNDERISIFNFEYSKNAKLTWYKGYGAFSMAQLGNSNSQKFDITPIDKSELTYDFGEGNTCVIKFSYSGEKDKYIEFDFKWRGVNTGVGNEKVDVKYRILSDSEVSELIKQEVEVRSELEEVEQPKEELVEPSEPEVVEPPKEEVVEPSEPEVVESPKEEIVIPSEPEIIPPSKEDIEIEE